jgi:pantoate--beta-alanine ligase
LETIRTIAWMKEKARAAKQEGRVLGLVPTMGALHAGHLALLQRARQECSPVFASIFLNPKQFAANEDLSRYPRPLEEDLAKLKAACVDGVFLPEALEMYPPGFSTYVHVERLSERLEGRSRPGHFRGVTTVVLKLLEIVQPNYAYFGRKDAQQAGMVQKMVRDLNVDTEIVLCPIVREEDGLAMSSRNVYLTEEERKAAVVLFRALKAAEEALHSGVLDTVRLQKAMRQVLDAEPRAKVDYAEVVDAETFEPVVQVGRRSYALLAVHVGSTRLIDNLLMESDGDGVRTVL